MDTLIENVKKDESRAKLSFILILALLTFVLFTNIVIQKTLLDFWTLILLVLISLLIFLFVYSQTNLFGMKTNYGEVRVFRDLTQVEKDKLNFELNQAGWVKRNLFWVILGTILAFLFIIFLIIFIVKAPNPDPILIRDLLIPVSIILVLYPVATLYQGSRYKGLKIDLENKVYESVGKVKIPDPATVVVNGLLFRGFEPSLWSEIRKSKNARVEFSLMTKTLWKVVSVDEKH